MATLAWSAFKTSLRGLIWPYPGEADNLVTVHDKFFEEAMNEIQGWVDQLKEHNIDVYPFCSTFFECAKSLINAPKGKITKVYTVVTPGWCNIVDYHSASYKSVEAWASEITNYDAPTGAPVQNGIYVAESTTDNTCAPGRARRGIWAIRNSKLYLAPYIQSNESIVVEWDGVKDSYLATDLIDMDIWGVPEQEAVRLFVQAKHELFFGDPSMAKALEQKFNDKLADLMYDYRENTKQQLLESSVMGRMPTNEELEADQVGIAIES